MFFHEERGVWIYATVHGATERSALEFHLMSVRDDEHHAQTLTALTHYALTGPGLGMGHTVNLGEGWMAGSACDYLLLSRPYLDGAGLERFEHEGSRVRCLWALPITRGERDYKAEFGLEALEQRLEDGGVSYADPERRGLV